MTYEHFESARQIVLRLERVNDLRDHLMDEAVNAFNLDACTEEMLPRQVDDLEHIIEKIKILFDTETKRIENELFAL